jgi:hypothetical protein
LEQLRPRYKDALVDLVDEEGLRLGTVPRPGERRQNVFDFPDGFRLIVSRDQMRLPIGTCIHFSASVCPGSMASLALQTALRVGGRDQMLEMFRRTAEKHFERLSGDDVSAYEFAGFRPGKGVPHWYRRIGK